MIVRNIKDLNPFIALDGSTIREIVHPNNTPFVNQSLAEARIKTGNATSNHIHRLSEEIYYILSGKGRMHLSKNEFIVRENDVIVIPCGIEHHIENIGDIELVFLCCSTPPYTNEDTEIL
jgi:mannose-6-phosphate isomerase-like protein (cupin superfamily)